MSHFVTAELRAAKIQSDSIQSAVEALRNFVGMGGEGALLHTGIILGSGLGAFGQYAIDRGGVEMAYDKIPGMPQPAVAGHVGRLVIGRNELQGVAVLQGRVHYYEGHPLSDITFATRLLHALGIQQLIVTNAAGGIRDGFNPGDLMLLNGHWTFLNVAESSATENRRGTTNHLWSTRLQDLASQIPTTLNVHQGVYAMMSGPNYETPAEVRMLQTYGVDAVGMSTVPEALAAANRGIDVLGVSCITNIASGLSDKPLDHSDVSETAAGVEDRFTEWMLNLVSQWN